ncbi:MAG: type II secretion system F family protein [Acidobacteriales bacterium]|nr:type II secretion system F family protein [Terriglobales bacterium]
MAEFVVKMADERGRTLQQVESAHTAEELRERFAMQGFLVYEVKPRSLLGVARGQHGKIKLEKFVIFNTQFVTLVRAGLPILTALELLERQQKDPYFKSVLEDVRVRVKSGDSLSSAFDAQNVASKLYSTTLLAGEKAGNLEETLGRWIAFQRIAIAFRKKLIAALIYPALLIAAMIGLLSVLILFVVPKFAQLYHEINAPLPPVTEFLLNFGQTAQAYLPIAGVVLLAAGVSFWQWRRTEAGQERMERIRRSLPLLGGVYIKYQVAMFSRMLSTLLAAGLPLVASLETAGLSMGSLTLKKGIQSSVTRVLEGKTLAGSLAETKVFPEMSIGMIEVGESTGALPQMLTSVAEFYEEDVQTALAAALALIEPVILLIMGGVVAIVLISLYLPIFNLGAQIR